MVVENNVVLFEPVSLAGYYHVHGKPNFDFSMLQ